MPHCVSIQDAAVILGISPQTVRRRVKAGQLPVSRERTATGYQWWVHVDYPADHPVDHPADHPLSASVPAPAPVSTGLAEHLAQENEWLRSLVANQQQTIDRLTVLLKQAQDAARPALSAGDHLGDRLGNQPADHHNAPPARPAPSSAAAPSFRDILAVLQRWVRGRR